MTTRYLRIIALGTVLGLGLAFILTRMVRDDAAAAPPDMEYRVTTLPQVSLPVRATRAPADYDKPYTFRTDWFSHNVPLWQAVLEPYRGKPDVSYLEIGLFEGRSALWILENVLTHPTSRLTGIDPFGDPGATDEVAEHGTLFFANLELSGLATKATIIRGYSQTEMRKLPLHAFDVIYIDGSHVAGDVLEDAILARRLLKDEGVLIFDDYRWQRGSPPGDRPEIALDWFYALFRGEFDVIDTSYQAILKKKRVAAPEGERAGSSS